MNEETNLRASNFRSATPAEGAVLVVDDLKVHIPTRRNMGPLRAVDGVSFEVARGKTLGIVGESGCGKSTTARAIMRLQEPTAGSIQLLDTDITHLKGEALRAMRRHCQMVFQDPYSALNPRLTVGQIVSEPLQAQGSALERLEGVWTSSLNSLAFIRGTATLSLTSSPEANDNGLAQQGRSQLAQRC